MTFSRLALALSAVASSVAPSAAHGADKMHNQCKERITKQNLHDFWENYEEAYIEVMQSKDCDTSALRDFYIDSEDTTSFDWTAGALGGTAVGIDTIMEQLTNTCNLLNELAPGFSSIVKEDNIEELNTRLGRCVMTQSGINTWTLKGGAEDVQIKQRFTYVMIKDSDDKRGSIYQRHASLPIPVELLTQVWGAIA